MVRYRVACEPGTPARRRGIPDVPHRLRRAAVVVLGDLGRSPRMLHHARVLAAHGCRVDLVGYSGSALPADIRDNPLVHVHAIADERFQTPPGSQPRVAYLARSAWRAVALSVRLLSVLLRIERPDVILVQNPPGLPTLPIAWAAARLRGARFGIDWHNLTSAMLALRVGERHALVRATGVLERLMGLRADHNIFVSQAMRERLRGAWHLKGLVFKDRPARAFSPLDHATRTAIRARVLADLPASPGDPEPLLVVSPTSWSADEDFGLLVDAAAMLDRDLTRPGAATRTRHVFVLLTGRGPLRQDYERRIATLHLSRVTVRTAWFEPDEYPQIVAAADLGVSVHRSASGLDLPMKVMDFFGAGVPVAALHYGACLEEAVRHGDNGLLFANAEDLARQLSDLAAIESGRATLETLQRGAREAGTVSWEDAWAQEVWPALAGGLGGT